MKPGFFSYSEKFSDLTLRLVSQNSGQELLFKCHKNILGWQIPYFEKLFLFPGNEEKKEFIVTVDDPEVTELFLLSFYGSRVGGEWTPYQILQIIKLRSFFCLDLSPQDLHDLNIAEKDFPLLLEVISLPEMPDVESDPRLRRTVKKNIPPDYDWRGVDESFKKIITASLPAMISASIDETLRMWDIVTGDCLQIYTGHTDSVCSVAVIDNPERKTMISASDDDTLRRWDIVTGECLKVYSGHTSYVRSVVILSGSERVQREMISASSDQTLRRWDIATGECLQVYSGHTRGVNSVVILSDPDAKQMGREMISASSDKTLRRWDIATGECLQIYTGHADKVESVAICDDPDPKKRTMISASEDKTLRRWDIATGECLQVYTGHTSSVNSVAICNDPDPIRTMISASSDRTLRRWDITTGQCLHVYDISAGYYDYVRSVVISPDQKTMISGSDTLNRWDIATGECLGKYEGHNHSVLSVALLEI